MLKKRITHKSEMYGNIKEGIDSIASIVGRTLGPGGLPILIERVGQALNGEPLGPMITKDGVTVAGECASDDPLVDVVIQAVKDICSKTNRVAGDGTTTAIVLGQALLEASLEVIEREHLNPQQVRLSLELAAKEVQELLTLMSTACTSYDMIEHVATISANGDREIGSVIRGAFEAVGTEGIITVDEGNGSSHNLTVVDGFQIRRGAEAGDRFLNNPERTKFEAEKVHVVLFDGKLHNPNQAIVALKVIYDKYAGKMPPVVFIANEFSNEVLQVFMINRAEGGLSICAVKSPHQTKVTTAMLDDIAVYLGGNRLGNGNRSLEAISFSDVGIADRIVVDKYSTTFFGGAGEESDVLARIEQLKAQREEAESPYDAAIVSDRISSLAEGIAKIGVGGSTDLEVKEKYHRIEDAVNAARAAIAEGVIPGGGVTLLRISENLAGQSIGHEILNKALKAPFIRLLSNVGYPEDQIVTIIEDLLQDGPLTTTWDGVTHKKVPALEAGIIDPVKVTKTALLNAISIAGLLSTCGGAITIARG